MSCLGCISDRHSKRLQKDPHKSNDIVQLSTEEGVSCHSYNSKRVDVLRITEQLMRVPRKVDVLVKSVLVSNSDRFGSLSSVYIRELGQRSFLATLP